MTCALPRIECASEAALSPLSPQFGSGLFWVVCSMLQGDADVPN